MAYLFYLSGGAYQRIALNPDDSPLSLHSLTASPARSTTSAPAGLWLSHTAARRRPYWLLHIDCNRPVRVNGLSVDTGIRILHDRDAISWTCATSAYFSAESRPSIVAFPATGGDIDCARCRLPIEVGKDATACPGCGTWFHQLPDEELGCWLDAAECMRCEHPTAYDAPPRWTPASL